MVGNKRFKFLAWLCLGATVFLLSLALLRQPKAISSGSLTLPDGAVVRVIAATYGTNHILGPPLARLVARFPQPVRIALGDLLGSRAVPLQTTTTSRPALVLWLADSGQRTNAGLASHSGYCKAVLADAGGFASGDQVYVGDQWSRPQSLAFYAIPRRDRVISVEFFYHAPNGGVTSCGKLSLENPLYGSFPQWQPATLPATNRAGDVEMVVQRLSTGHNSGVSYKTAEGGGRVIEFGTNQVDERIESVCLCTLHSLTHTNEVWRVANEEVSDATGNRVGNSSMSWGSDADGYFAFEPGLWPTESAWKLNCEIKRAQGFTPAELLVLREVPLGKLDATNQVGWTTNFHGAVFTLDHIVRRAPHTNDHWSSDTVSRVSCTLTLARGLHLDLLSARTDSGTNLECVSWGGGANSRSYTFRAIPLAAKTADFTFAVHRSRWVAFTLRPEVGTARLDSRPDRRQ